MLEINEIDSFEQFELLRDVWNEALAKSNANDVHLTWEWFYAWWNNFGEDGLYVLIVREEERILAIAPFMKNRRYYLGLPVRRIGLPVSILNRSINFYTPYFDIILVDKEEECINAIFSHIEKKGWDVIEFGNVALHSRTISLLEGMSKKGRFYLYRGSAVRMSPYIPIISSWDEYYSWLSRKFKRDIRRREKRLKEIGKVSFEEIKDTDNLKPYLEKFFQTESSGWKLRTGTAILCSKKTRGFYTDLAYLASRKDWLRILFLKVDNHYIASEYSLEYNGVMNMEKSGYDPQYSRYSPSNLLVKRVLEKIFEDGVIKYNFMGLCEDWKKEWTSNAQELVPICIYRKGMYPGIIYYLQFGIKDFLKRFAFFRAIRKLLLKIYKDR